MSRFPSGFTSEAIVKDAMSGDEADDEFSLSGLTTGAKRYASGGAATTAMPATLATQRTGRTRPSGEATQPMTDCPPRADSPPRAGAKRSADDWAVATAKLATGATAKERAKDRTATPIARPSEGGHPRRPSRAAPPLRDAR